MAEAPIVVIAHPGAGRGAFARVWPAVARELEARSIAFDVRLTTRAMEAADFARQAAAEGASLVLSVGGDGTLHEVVNGLLADDRTARDLPALGLVPAGRGSDYARGLDLPRHPASLAARFAAAVAGDPEAAHPVDVGEVTYRPSHLVAGRPAPEPPVELAAEPDNGERAVRRFINGAGVGFSPFVAQRTARFPARLGAYLYTAAALLTIVDWGERRVALRWAEGTEEDRAVESIELALGGYEGGGMHVAPGADPSDGLFDAVLVDATSRYELFTFAWRIRSGDHLRSPRVELRRTAGLEVAAADGRGPIYLQADGELLGRDPFAFRMLPAAVRFVW
ncbi:MAG: diacylglycerol kinase catalytic domain-containing protein [Chloroflexi bacterium CSP1-4]|nr:MAG: diacylglycerol kinase catalytic domain-containing protein [Chloroflexi bacterium CSP1-4]